MKPFHNPFMQALNTVADLLWLNFLALICCLPVITVGPSLTALHYTALKMARDEECYIARDFFRSFKLNFRQGVVIWLLMLFLTFIIGADFFVIKYAGSEAGGILEVFLIVTSFLIAFVGVLVFPVLARFENTIPRTVKNAFLIGVGQLPRTLLMMAVSAVPALLYVFSPGLIPLVVLFGFSAPAWVCAKLYSGFFRKLEQGIAARTPSAKEDAEGRIFRDEVQEGPADGR